MKSCMKRAAASLLAFCLVLTLLPSALAAGTNTETLSAAAREAGFDYCYEETYREISAVSPGGEASVSISAPEGVIAGRGVYAAVLPLDGENRTVFFATVAGTGPYTVRCAREGCSSFAVMLVQPVIDGGGIALSTGAVYHESTGAYTVTYTASMTMSDDLAEIAVVNRSDPQMDDLEFTCYLTDPLVGSRDSITAEHISFTGGVFELAATERTEGGWKASFRLVNGWNEGGAAQVKARLQEPMTITVKETVSSQELQSKLVDRTLYSCGQLLITNAGGGAIPSLGTQKQITLPTNLAEMSFSEDSSGTVVSSYPIKVETADGGAAAADRGRAVEGTKITVTVTPEDGYRFGSLKILDSYGRTVSYTDNGDGTCSFIMPASGVKVSPVFLRAIATPVETGIASVLEAEDHILFMIGDDKGNFRPDDDVTRAEVVMIFYRLLLNRDVPTTVTFSDVPSGAWYEEAVNTLASLGIVQGVGGGMFQPERPITRAEFAAIAVRFARTVPDSAVTFPDVNAEHWASDEIGVAAAFGWVVGDDHGNFRPDANISRAETATIVNRMLGRPGDKAAINEGEGRSFPDVTSDHWAWYEIGEATTAHDYTRNDSWTIEDWE